LLDDVDLSRDEVTTLMDVAPRCTFVLTSAERRLWSGGRAVSMRGLPVEDALELVEQELGRPLTAEEEPAARDLCTALEGEPLRILQAAAEVREEGGSLAEAARQARTPAEAPATQVVLSLSEAEKRILTLLAAMNGVPLSVEHLVAVTGIADAASILESLRGRGLVQTHSPTYSLSGTLAQDLQQLWDVTPLQERLPAPAGPTAEETALRDRCLTLVPQTLGQIEALAVNEALAQVMDAVGQINRYLERAAPWRRASAGQSERVATILYTAVEALRLTSILLQPVLPGQMAELWRRLGWQAPASLPDGLSWGLLQPGAQVVAGPPLFPRERRPRTKDEGPKTEELEFQSLVRHL